MKKPLASRMDKLPKWACAYIHHLEAERNQAQHEYALLKESNSKCHAKESSVILDHGRKNEEYVDDHTSARFVFDKDRDWREFIEVRFESYRPGIKAIHIYGGNALHVLPMATNSAYVLLEKLEYKG